MDVKTLQDLRDKMIKNRPLEPKKWNGGLFGDSLYAGCMKAEFFIQNLIMEKLDLDK